MKQIIRRLAVILAVIMLLGTCTPALAAGSTRPCNHEWDEGTILHYPKCTERGLKQYTCRRCGATKTEAYGKPLGHDWGEWSDPVKNGDSYERTRSCKRCGLKETDEVLVSPAIQTTDTLYLEFIPENGETTTLNDITYVSVPFFVENQGSRHISVDEIETITAPNEADLNTYEGSYIVFTDDPELEPNAQVHGVLYVPVDAKDTELLSVSRNMSVFGFTEDSLVISNTASFTVDITAPEEPSLHLELISAVPNGLEVDDTVEVELLLTNNGPCDLDYGNWSSKDHWDEQVSTDTCPPPENSVLVSGESITFKAQISLRVKDYGYGKIIRYISFSYISIDDPSETVTSNAVLVEVEIGDPEWSEDALLLECVSADGTVTLDGNTFAAFTFRLTNTSPDTVDVSGQHQAVTADNPPMSSETRFDYDASTVLAPSESLTGRIYVYITGDDTANMKLGRNVTMFGTVTEDGEPVTSNEVLFEQPLSDPDPDPIPEKQEAEITVKLELTSHSKIPGFYQAGEPIEFLVTVTNTGDIPINSLEMYEYMEPVHMPVSSFMMLKPNENWYYTYIHIVQPDEVPYGPLLNYATVTGFTADDGTNIKADSNDIWVDLGEPIGPVDPKTDLCSVSLIVGEEGTLAYVVSHCSAHTAVAEEAEKIVEEAGSDPAARAAAYEKVAALWTDSINALYGEIFDSAESDTAKVIITNERTAFFAWVDAYTAFLTELYPDQPAFVAEKRAELLREKCAELCWYASSRKDALPDSILKQTVPQNGSDECAMELRTERPDMLVYALNFCPEHTLAELELHEATLRILEGGTDAAALQQVRISWESLAMDAESSFTGPVAEAEQTAYAAYRKAHVPFIRLFRNSELACDDALVKMALTRTLRLCPMFQNAEPEGGTAPTYTNLF